MNLVSVEAPPVRVAAAREALEFGDPLLRIAAVIWLSHGAADQMIDTLSESGGLFADARKKTLDGHAGFHRLIIRELESGELRPRRGKPRLYGSAGGSAGAELCASIA
jgi:hypothetical protein